MKTDWNCWFRMLALSVGFVASSPVVWDSREPIWTLSVLFLFTKDQKAFWGGAPAFSGVITEPT